MTDDELNQRFDDLKAHIDQRFDASIEFTRSIETSLLKAFRNWAVRFESRFKANDILVRTFDERLAAVEDRVSDLERGGEAH